MSELKQDHGLQAVILADSFNTRFRPITYETPKVLLPIVNVPMIAYTLEFLASAGVNEVFVYCSAHAAMVKEYIQDSKWSKLAPEFNVVTVNGSKSNNVGDAMRDLDDRELIKTDFVLISGDVISNINLAPVLKAHAARRKVNPILNIMTVVFKKAHHNHVTRRLDDDLVVLLDAHPDVGKKGKLILFDDNASKSEMSVETEVLDNCSADLDMHYDLLDCHIDICAPAVLKLFTENFDYEDIRKDFIRGILTSDIVGNSLFAHIVDGEYAARCQDLHTYDAISKDVIHRWTFPMVPETNMLFPTTFKLSRGNRYKEQGVMLQRSCEIGVDTVLGKGTRVGDHSKLSKTVVGRFVTIGNNVTITNSYIWDDVTIGDGVVLDGVILCNNVVLRENVTIHPGSIVSYNVVVAANTVVEAHSKLTTLPRQVPNPDDPFAIDSDDEEDLTTVDVPGTGSVGRYYVRKKAEAKVKVVQLPVIDAKKYRRDSTSSQSDNVVLDDSGNEDGLEAKELQRHKGPVTTPFKVTLAMLNSIAPPVETRLVTTHNIDDDMKDFDAVEIEEIENSEEDLLREVRETLQRAHENNLELDGIILDMTNIKLSAEATLTDYAMATFLGLLSLVGVTEESKSGKVTATVVAALQTSLEKWLLVLSKFTRDLDDQMCVVMGLEAACMYHPNFNAFFQFLLQQSYDLEILPEEAVLAWEKLRVSQAQEANLPTPDMVTRAQVFLSWLKESDEDSEEESESD